MRAAGGVCIADEVQTGFGRLGTHLWGFEAQEVVPDIVVLGKPIGNGFPLAAVVTTRDDRRLLRQRHGVLQHLRRQPGGRARWASRCSTCSRTSGSRSGRSGWARSSSPGLRRLQDRHPLIGDVRGSGLFLGVELVRDRASLEPADAEAAYVVERLRERGVLTGTDGPHHNVLKLRPPLVFGADDVDLFLATLDEVLGEDGAQPGR